MSSHEQLQPRDGSFYPLGGEEPLVSKLHCITGHHEEMAADFSFWRRCSAFRLTLWLEGYVERFLILALTVDQAKDCQKYSCWLLCQSCPKANASWEVAQQKSSQYLCQKEREKRHKSPILSNEAPCFHSQWTALEFTVGQNCVAMWIS